MREVQKKIGVTNFGEVKETKHTSAPVMNATHCQLLTQCWSSLQNQLLLDRKQQCGSMRAKLKLIKGVGHKSHDRSALARAFSARAIVDILLTLNCIFIKIKHLHNSIAVTFEVENHLSLNYSGIYSFNSEFVGSVPDWLNSLIRSTETDPSNVTDL